jgi:hypothetical protein
VLDVAVAGELAFVEVVAEQFVEGFGVGLGGGDHFGSIAWLFDFEDDGSGIFGRFALVDDEILAIAGIDKVVRGIVGCFEEIGDEVFEMLFAFGGGIINVADQLGELALEMLDVLAGEALGEVGGGEGFGGGGGQEDHRKRVIYSAKVGIKNLK